MVRQSIKVNFIPGVVQDRLHASQNDTGERVFSFLCYYGSSLYEIPEGASITINGQKPGGYFFVVPCAYDGSMVTCDCKDTMTDVAGEVTCELQVVVGGEVVQSANFILDVEKSAIDSSVVPRSDYESISQMVSDAQAAAQEAGEAAEEAEAAAQSIDPDALMKYADLTTGSSETQAGKKGVDATLLNQSNANALLNRSQLNTSGTVTESGKFPADAWQLNPNNNGSYAAGVASQIGDLSNSIESLPKPIFGNGTIKSPYTGSFAYVKYGRLCVISGIITPPSSQQIAQEVVVTGIPKCFASNSPIIGLNNANNSVHVFQVGLSGEMSYRGLISGSAANGGSYRITGAYLINE